MIEITKRAARSPHVLAIALAVAVAALLRFPVLFMGPVAIDATFLPDDTYYVLSLARSIAAGEGPTTDGSILTSGFQPVFVFLLTPVFWATSDLDLALKFAVGLSAFFGVTTVGLAAHVAARCTGSGWAAFVTGLLIATCPPVFFNDLNGLETSLSATSALLLILAFLRAREAPAARMRLIVLGLAAGLAPLARIDLVFLTVILGAWGITALGWARTLLVGSIALTVALPWISYCLVIGGLPLPESGQAVRAIVEYNAEQGWIILFSVLSGIDRLARIVEPLPSYAPVHTSGVVFLLFLAMLVQSGVRRAMTVQGVLAITAMVSLSFYVLYLRADWFFSRYFHLVFISFFLGAVLGSAEIALPRIKKALVTIGLGIAGLNAVATIAILVPGLPNPYDDDAVIGDYRGAALSLLPEVRSGSTVTAMQSGALGYYAPSDVRVVNLDGVVNGNAYRASQEGRLGDYLIDIGADYFADWEINVEYLLHMVDDPTFADRLEPVASGGIQQGFQMVLYRIGPDR